MSSVTFQYKCRRCGEIFSSGTSTGTKNGKIFLTDLLINGKLIEKVVGSSFLTSWELHECNDVEFHGGVGIGDIVGFE